MKIADVRVKVTEYKNFRKETFVREYETTIGGIKGWDLGVAKIDDILFKKGGAEFTSFDGSVRLVIEKKEGFKVEVSETVTLGELEERGDLY